MAQRFTSRLFSRELTSLHTKLLASFLTVSLLPLAIIVWVSVNRSTDAMTTAVGQRMEVAAIDAADKIDRNLFERYGDVQAFAANPLAVGSPEDSEQIVDFLMTTYGIYDLMLIVDLDGRVITANTVDGFGARVNTGDLVGLDVSNEDWFKVIAGGNTPVGGTYYTDVERSPLVRSVYNDDRLTLPFSAPILDADGEIIAIWHNDASFERVVADIMASIRFDLAASGATTIDTQVIDGDGLLIDDADSAAVLTLNLADTGVEAAQLAVDEAGSGFSRETNTRSGVDQFNGYAVSRGALGFAGYGWGVLVRQDVDEALTPAHSLRNYTLILAGLFTIFVAGAAVMVARGVAKPIIEISERSERIAKGDLKVELTKIKRNDEIGALGTAFNKMSTTLSVVGAQAQTIADGDVSSEILEQEVPGELGEAFKTMIASLKSMVNQLKESSEQLAGAAEELTAVSTSMAANADLTSTEATSASAAGEYVSSNVATVAAAIEEMNSSIQEVATNATAASGVASEAVEVARYTSRTIEKLGDSSGEIGDVIKVIRSIAEQTNLLALNATIEAARAGEAGKGFAVVANEVKELANQTASATEEISTRIQALQSDTSGAVEANIRIGETVDKINEISASIATAVEEQSVATAEIGRSVEEAALGSQDIARSITDVASAAEATRQSTDETRTSADQMSHMASELYRLVSNYR